MLSHRPNRRRVFQGGLQGRLSESHSLSYKAPREAGLRELGGPQVSC